MFLCASTDLTPSQEPEIELRVQHQHPCTGTRWRDQTSSIRWWRPIHASSRRHLVCSTYLLRCVCDTLTFFIPTEYRERMAKMGLNADSSGSSTPAAPSSSVMPQLSSLGLALTGPGDKSGGCKSKKGRGKKVSSWRGARSKGKQHGAAVRTRTLQRRRRVRKTRTMSLQEMTRTTRMTMRSAMPIPRT